MFSFLPKRKHISLLLVENQRPDLDALPRLRIRRCGRVFERRMRRPDSESFLPTGLSLTPGIIALQQKDLIGRHVLDVVEAVLVARSNTH